MKVHTTKNRISLKERLSRLKNRRPSLKKRVKFASDEEEESITQQEPENCSFVSVESRDSDGEDQVDRAVTQPPFTPAGITQITRSGSILSSAKKLKQRKQMRDSLTRNGHLITESSDVIHSDSLSHNIRSKMSKDAFSIYDFIDIDKPVKRSSSTEESLEKASMCEQKHVKKTECNPNFFDSRVHAENCFKWLISPYNLREFNTYCWQKTPLLLKRHQKSYYGPLMTTDELEKILKNNDVQFTRNIDIAIYKNDERETLNADGRVYPALAWDKFNQGCSVRMLNPQTYSKPVWQICSILQEYFHSFVGTNLYLTPAGSQGFAPHHDDIDAFILQLEGTKCWKVYAPLDVDQQLPRFSSRNLKREELADVKPLITAELHPGDLLYLPRGFIHEARTTEDVHSLHLTISCGQRHTYGDLFETLLPQALQTAMQEEVEFRESLPIKYLNYMGVVNQDAETPERDEFLKKVRGLFDKLIQQVNVDLAVDHFSKAFMHSSLPPVLSEREQRVGIVGGGEHWSKGKVETGIEIDLSSQIKLVRHGSVRIIVEDECARLYHNMENSRVYQENDPQYVEIANELTPAVEHLIAAYPNLTLVKDLPLDSDDEKVDIASLLFDKALILVAEDCEMMQEDGDSI